MGMGDDNTKRMKNDLIVDFPCRKQSASSSKSKSKPKVRFSNTSRLYVIARATPEEATLLWNSSKEMADFKCRFAITVRKTWQVLNDNEVSYRRISFYIF